jgi:starch synthase
MEILFVTSEVAPFSKATGLADVCGALPKALRGLGHKVTVLSPLYPHIDPAARSLARRLMKIEVQLGGKKVACELYDGRTPGGVDLLFLGHEELFRRVPHVYGEGDAYALDAQRFALLSLGALELIKKREPRFDVLHAHDWPAALAVFMAKRDPALAALPTVLTIHDLAHQGSFPKAMMETLGLPWSLFTPEGLEFYGLLNVLKGGVLAASRVTTVSPAYAQEIRTPEGGHGLDGVLRARGKDVLGILDGVDVAVWNPATDAALPSRFDPIDLAGKARCKSELQQACGLPQRADLPLLAASGKLTPGRGFDLLAKALPQVLRNDVQLVIHAEGDADADLHEVFAELASRWPDRLALLTGDESATHRVLGGSDLFVIPSRTEPSGHLQRYAHRYGTLPICRRTGGHIDTVVDLDAKLEGGSGFLYDEETPQALLGAIRRGVAAFTLKAPFDAARRRVMRIDHSWERSARLYESLYRELLTPKD